MVRRLCWLWPARRLRNRRDGFALESAGQILPVRIEDAGTTQKVKVVSEDQGICILDGERRRLLIECCAYRYLIRAGDVVELRAISARALSGVVVGYRVGSVVLSLALCSAGHGAMASLVQSYAPQFQAGGMLRQIRATLRSEERRVGKE